MHGFGSNAFKQLSHKNLGVQVDQLSLNIPMILSNHRSLGLLYLLWLALCTICQFTESMPTTWYYFVLSGSWIARTEIKLDGLKRLFASTDLWHGFSDLIFSCSGMILDTWLLLVSFGHSCSQLLPHLLVPKVSLIRSNFLFSLNMYSFMNCISHNQSIQFSQTQPPP